MGSPITVSDLTYAYHGNGNESQAVFEGATFEVAQGEIVCLVGPSGCGKSTLLNLIAGFLTPQRGTISIGGVGSEATGRIGYIFQRDALLPWRTVEGNITLASELRQATGNDDQQKIAEYLRTFNLEPSVLKKYPAELSGGMRQRVSIVQSLMTDPDILLLDEPFSALDFYTKLRLEDEFRSLVVDTGKAALFVTHDIDEAVTMGDRILIMGSSPRGIVDEARISFDGGPRPKPADARGHARFGEYFARVWDQLRDGD